MGRDLYEHSLPRNEINKRQLCSRIISLITTHLITLHFDDEDDDKIIIIVIIIITSFCFFFSRIKQNESEFNQSTVIFSNPSLKFK